MAQAAPVEIETALGKPIEAFGRVLTPVVCRALALRHRGTIRTSRVEGWGWGFALVRPVAVVEETQDGSVSTIPIPDVTHKAIAQMAVVAVVIPIVAIALMLANRLTRED